MSHVIATIIFFTLLMATEMIGRWYKDQGHARLIVGIFTQLLILIVVIWLISNGLMNLGLRY